MVLSRARCLGLALLLVAVTLAGCTSSNPPPADNNPPPTDTDGQDGFNDTPPVVFKPPVARMQVFDASNALAFESDFVAENRTAPVFVTGGANLTFSAANSAAVEATASVQSWRWSFGDGGFSSGRTVQHAFTDLGGLFTTTLTVTDSHQLSDVLNIVIAAEPTKTFNVTYNVTGALQGGLLGLPMQPGVDTETKDLNVSALVQGYPVVPVSAKFTLHPGEPTSDFDFSLKDPNGNTTQTAATEPAPGADEVMTLGAGDLKKPGTYQFAVVLYAGANGTYSITGEVIYKVVNPNVPAKPST
ncbi:MAG: PKD domain-containing protein [Halobacteriales archaeon]|nr:PKD domain-containing protein [Halobacteriales archaeon]